MADRYILLIHFQRLHTIGIYLKELEVDSISVALNTSAVSGVFTPGFFEILNVFWQDRAYYWSSLEN